ncbi:MAG: hypothetical protein HQ594_01680 [Candidatus Omnitrophica bacterium]|nr:hypothetical protein [Candidatus Omnitrophota bacterium]
MGDNPADRIANALREGKAVYLSPYKEPKVWGAGGIGEYWYGAEAGDKSSVASLGGDEAPMADVLELAPVEILGEGAVKKFGDLLPLVKILTPKGRLSVQFHDAKNELWIVTGVDESAAGGKEPSVIVGFSSEAVDEYGPSVTSEYHEALKEYGVQLNALIDLLLQKRFKEALEETKDVVLAAESAKESSPQIAAALDKVTEARGKLEKFYNYIPVKIGDVIPIPCGTLHALGSGVEVVEPQIPGPTQSLEDGATYPVRYYFPGHERGRSKKKLDIDRAEEMIPDVVKESPPEVISEADSVKIERLPGGFEDKGLEVHRITMEGAAEANFSDITSFHTLVSVAGEAMIVTSSGEYEIPKAAPGGKMLLVPASAGEYKIVSSSGAQIIDTFTPLEIS